MRRAIRDEQKEARRQAILDAAWRLFQETPYDALNMSDVARSAGLAKGTVYLYFKSKETLFLAIQAQQFEAWFDEVDAELADARHEGTISAVAPLITASLDRRPALTRLFAILHVILEHNIPLADARAFKQMLRERLFQTGRLLEEALPFLRPGQGGHLLLQTYALAIGVQHLAHPAPVVRRVLEQEPDLAVFDLAFADEFRQAFTRLCHGVKAENET